MDNKRVERYLNDFSKDGYVNMYESELPEFRKILDDKNIKYGCWYDDVGGCSVQLNK